VFCPKCKSEYVPGYTFCSDCQVALVDGPPEPEPTAGKGLQGAKSCDLSAEPVSLVTVLASGDPVLMGIIKSLLESADIPFVVKGEGLGDVTGFGRAGSGFNPITGPMELQVRAEDAEDVRLLLGDLGTSQNAGGGEKQDS
jgi:hypothetical protein